MQKLPLAYLHNLVRGAVLIAVAAATVVAQEASNTPDDADNGLRGLPVTLAGQFFDHDFVNYTLFANAIYDTISNSLPAAPSSSYSGFGYSVGGGVTAGHLTRHSSFSLNYRGAYRHYGTATYGSGTDQNLGIDYSRRLNRRWSMGANVAGGILFYGGGFYGVGSSPGNTVVPNPLGSETRFLSAGLSFTYQQTRRLSYVFGGQFFLNNYSYANAINSVGGSGTASVVYRLTARTNVAGTYYHTYYTYGSNGQSTTDGGSLTLSHDFGAHWQASLTAGVSRTHSLGTISIPISIIVGQQLVSGYVTGPYDQVSLVPSFQGSLTHYLRRSSVSISAGQGVQPGNGIYLTSRTQFVNGTYSRSTRRSNISLGGGYFRLTSIANSVSQSYNTANLAVSYSYVVRRHLAADFRYDLIKYGGILNSGGSTENRFTFGISFSSQSIPLTLF